jgi:hypothetical protein
MTTSINKSRFFDSKIVDYCTTRFRPDNSKDETEFIREATEYLVRVRAIAPIRDTYKFNTGPLAEYALQEIVRERWGIIHTRVDLTVETSAGKSKVITPDFYHHDLPFMVEIKSRSYYGSGTASEKLDGIPRKYHPATVKYKKPLLIVFAAGQIVEPLGSEILSAATAFKEGEKESGSMLQDFIAFAHKYGVLDWVGLSNGLYNKRVDV